MSRFVASEMSGFKVVPLADWVGLFFGDGVAGEGAVPFPWAAVSKPRSNRSQAVAGLHREFRMKGQDTLVVAGTHEEIAHINEAVRQDRKEHSELSTGRHFDTYISLQWAAAQKQDISDYQGGLVLQFNRNTKVANRHESLEVVRLGPESLVARKESGEEVGKARSGSTSHCHLPAVFYRFLCNLLRPLIIVRSRNSYGVIKYLSKAYQFWQMRGRPGFHLLRQFLSDEMG